MGQDAHQLKAGQEIELHGCSGESSIEEDAQATRLTVLQRLGVGGWAHVYQVLRVGSSQMYALKVSMSPAPTTTVKSMFDHEATILRHLGAHPGIVRLMFSGSMSGHSALLLELAAQPCSVEDLYRRTGPLPDATAACFTAQAAQSLAHIHSRGVLHRDVRCANLLLGADGRVKLSDFGVSCVVPGLEASKKAQNGDCDYSEQPQAQGLAGTPRFRAPEVSYGSGYDDTADIWSLGATLLEMLTAEAPFSHLRYAELEEVQHDISGQLQQHSQPPLPGEHARPEYQRLSPGARAFIAACCQFNPAARPSAEQVLQHPYLTSGGAK